MTCRSRANAPLDVHDGVTQLEVTRRKQRLREEVSEIIDCLDEGNDDLERFNSVAYVKVAAQDVLGACVVLRIVREVVRTLAIGDELGRAILGHERRVDPLEQLAKVNDLFGCFGKCDDLRLARGESDAILLL